MKLPQTRKILLFIAVLAMTYGLTSCKTTQNDAAEPQTPASENVSVTQDEQANETAPDNESASTHSLPAYRYTGDDPIQQAVIHYLISEIGKNYDLSDVCIPSISIVGIDTDNPEDISVWGDFWIFNYKLDNDTLLTQSGGSHPGRIHLKKSDDGYTVTSMDSVADGEDNEQSAKEIFASRYDDFHQINANQEEREKIRQQFISDYVKANQLPIKKVKDFGWDAVDLPL